MEVIVKIFATGLCALFIVAIICLFSIGFHYLTFFFGRKCKQCGKELEYRGIKEGNKKEDDKVLFQCPRCGYWEEVPENLLHENKQNVKNTV